MNSKTFLALAIAAVGVGTPLAYQSSVSLQVFSPGTQQTGNSNISGTARAGTVIATNASTTAGATAVLGSATGATGATVGVKGSASSTDGKGVVGTATATTGNGIGGYFETASSGGYATKAVNTAGGTSVWGVASSTGKGVGGSSTSTSALGVGVQGETLSTAGVGVYGIALATSGTPYGVKGSSTSPSGYGLYALGNSGASGTKSFRIDHPSDPENKYLLHYSAESPMPQNFYLGNVVTDARGFAWVNLPDYFSQINTNFKYQLTVIGESFAQAIVSKKIVGNRFQIRTSVPHTEVSWEVKADRNDLAVRQQNPRDVIEKVGLERGTYQRPDLYGLGPERGAEPSTLTVESSGVAQPRK